LQKYFVKYMSIINKIIQRIDKFYQQKIVKEQYPMLTTLSQKKLQGEGVLGIVYMLHHISEKDKSRIPTNEDLKVSQGFLEQLILKYRQKGFDFISLDELSRILSKSYRVDRPFVSFTIDDGYVDNYTNALPIFEKYQVPFAVFVATDFIDKRAVLWWDSIEDLILSNEIVLTSDGKTYPCTTYQERWDTFRYLRERILELNQNRIEQELQQMFCNYEIDWQRPIKEKGMSWEQVRKLANHPLCTIGGHTISHPSLKKLSSSEAHYEIEEGRRKLEQVIGQPINFFAYPYGTPNEVGERELQIVSEQGFKLAFCAYGGGITAKMNTQPYSLPRVYLHENK